MSANSQTTRHFYELAPFGTRATESLLPRDENPSSVRPKAFDNLLALAENPIASSRLSERLVAGERAKPGETTAGMKIELPLADTHGWAGDTPANTRTDLESDHVVLDPYIDLGAKDGGRIRVDLRLKCRYCSGKSQGLAGGDCWDDSCRNITAARTDSGRKSLGFGRRRRADSQAECQPGQEEQYRTDPCGNLPVTPSRLADSLLILSPFDLACLTGTATVASRNARPNLFRARPPEPPNRQKTSTPSTKGQEGLKIDDRRLTIEAEEVFQSVLHGGSNQQSAGVSKRTETILETPGSSMVTPYSTGQISIVRLLCVIKMNCVCWLMA